MIPTIIYEKFNTETKLYNIYTTILNPFTMEKHNILLVQGINYDDIIKIFNALDKTFGTINACETDLPCYNIEEAYKIIKENT